MPQVTSRIATGAEIHPQSVIVDADVGPGAMVGPFCYLRPGTVLEADSKAGTFVEIKNSRIGERTKVPHLSADWNTITVTCKGPHITAAVNGETVAELNCDEWIEPHRCPDGSKNKFSHAIKDFARRGYIGLQDHGHKVWFKNVKIRELAAK